MKEFPKLSLQELEEVLNLSIKHDRENKLITFFAQLSAFTDEDQFNVSFNAPSATGKSYIPLEIASLFPPEDVMELGYCSPQSFFHAAEFNKESGDFIMDLSRKIIIFVDQPNPDLLSRLRSILSHDKKEMITKITDKSERKGMRTKTVRIIGYPSVIHCSAGLRMDEQEATRMFLLSPEISQEKIYSAVHEKAMKDANRSIYRYIQGNNEKRVMLQSRIRAIRDAHITQIVVPNPEAVFERFVAKYKSLKPRHSRDIGRVLSLAKIHALLNLWDRTRNNSVLETCEEDINGAFKIWDFISKSQDLNLPPYNLEFFEKIVIPASSSDSGYATKRKIIETHLRVYGRPLDDWRFRVQIIPTLEGAGLLSIENDPSDARSRVYRPIITTNGTDGDVGCI